jgi:hypothetical protein
MQVTSAYTPLVVSTLNIPTPQDFGCIDSGCPISTYPQGNITLTTAGFRTFFHLKSSNAATGGLFLYSLSMPSTFGKFPTNGADTMYFAVGSHENGVYNTDNGYVYQQFLLTPKVGTASVALELYQGGAVTPVSSASLGASGFVNTVAFTRGTTDVAPPDITGVAFSTTTVMTSTFTTLFTATITATDASGIWLYGVVMRAVPTGDVPQDALFSTNSMGAASNVVNIYVPAYVSGTYDMIGVFAVDQAGNAVLYGSCGSVSNIDSLCGTASAASSLAVSIFAVVGLALVALFSS